jgi:DNA-binding GntR family transcriptional regulator
MTADSRSTVAPSVSPVGRRPKALAAEVYERLLDAVVDGRLGPGEHLVQDRLAEELDVSRTPVRDALMRLHREGILEPGGRRGYLVREPAASEIRHFYEARMAIEGSAAQLLAAAGPGRSGTARSVLDEITSNPPRSTRESFDANRRLHRTIVAATGNNYLVDSFDAIWNRGMTVVIYRDFSSAYPYEGFVPEHRELLATLETVTPESARDAMIAHICSGLDRTEPRHARDGKP